MDLTKAVGDINVRLAKLAENSAEIVAKADIVKHVSDGMRDKLETLR